MTRKYELKAQETIDTINHLLDSGIQRISVILRHSDRFFSNSPGLEAFMGLTDQGKAFAVDFGSKIRSNPLPRMCSSFFGRCIETAYLIDKGFTRQNDLFLDHNSMDDMLAPFYIKDIKKALECVERQGTHTFLRHWFDRQIDEKIMENPGETADRLTQFMIQQIKHLDENTMAICVSHDWNIFPLKEFKMGLKHETAGDVGYLDGVIFFEKDNDYYITNYQIEPILL
jgi:broad specificity phosphatase PhoE